MKETEKAYIGIELKTHTWNVDLTQSGEQDVLSDGISGSPDDIYSFIYVNGYNCDEERLKFLLNDKGSGNMLYPIDCFEELSYNDWLKYKLASNIAKVEESLEYCQDEKVAEGCRKRLKRLKLKLNNLK